MANFNKFLGKIKPGMCRMSMNGIAINVNGEYKTYDVDKGILMNCDDFVFDIGDDMFFSIPCNNVHKGDIILASSDPVCVIEAKKNEIKGFDYKNGTLVSIVPERHIFFGSTYFYSKIFSPFANVIKGNNSMEKMAQYMMLSEMTKGDSDMGKMIGMAMMMNGGMDFSNMFNFDENSEEESDKSDRE